MPHIRVRQGNQLTLPEEIRSALHVEKGDLLQVYIRGNDVLLRPTRIMQVGTPQADEEDRRAEEDLREGRYKEFESLDEYASYLESSEPNAVGATGDAVERLVATALQSVHGDTVAAAERLEQARKSLVSTMAGHRDS